MDVWSITHRGAVREQNQDACRYHILGNGTVLALVCDGMGGARSGDIASTMAVDSFFEEYFSGMPNWNETEQQRLERAATFANARVFHRAENDIHCTGMGTTLVAVLATPDRALVLNEGDSRAYHLRSPQEIRQITRDHSLVEDLMAQGGITPEEAEHYPLRNVITRALGAELDLRTDFFYEEIIAGDFLLLCSDGLSNLVSKEEMAHQVYYGGEIEDCCKRLLQMALDRGAPDNVTVALITC